ncbi:hypothetical protein [Lacticaseibacillus zeae]|uniref:Uncharacterized protein n=1 Tax=Lacticaseibacillus zeae subsp. silagei TaxID=3068307 RepID=A0ABD7ZBR3_LACZE|nr:MULTISPECIES: hypothetical protein [Lacticaseibacillus]WLV84579.1 hypothetical protein LACZS2_001056 [Lacticaseibacillus sp. NCIMB 15475]WLV87335.1 hypothetical protein LACZS1_001056 [Lacticaseibacillus sp. NCIMB 15474]
MLSEVDCFSEVEVDADAEFCSEWLVELDCDSLVEALVDVEAD